MSEKENKKAVPLTEEQLIEKEAELNAKSEKLDLDIKDFEEFQENVFKIKEEFEAEKAAFEKEKAEFEAAKENTVVKENTPGAEFDFEGESYKFKDSAPKKIRINGEVLTQAQIIKKKDLLLQLVGGNSGLIQKL